MLVELVIENYAVIERLRVRFHAGLNVLTGETGSGKSIVVGALSLLFGARAAADMIRTGAERARISGVFEVPRDPALMGVLEAAGIDLSEDDDLLVEREILGGGKSRAFVSNRPATVALLRAIAPALGDIHGQHDQQRLFEADAQLEMLDAFAGAEPLVEETAGLYRRWNDSAAQLIALDRAEQEKLRLLDLWTFQRKEIESAAVKPGEDAELEAERRILQNVTRLQESATSAYEALYDAPDSALGQLRSASRKVEDLARIDPTFADTVDMLKPAAVAMEEASYTLRDYLGKLEADPDRLEAVESRLALLDKLKRKYGPSLDDVLALAAQVVAQIQAAETAGDCRAALEKERAALAAQYEDLAGRLTAKRCEAARKLEKRVENELRPLAMDRAVFRAELRAGGWRATGVDDLEFLLSANAGEEPRALARIASGGELSRIALALKTCVTSPRRNRTLVFDEVDAGIGGAAAEAVGRRLKQLAGAQQVLCVTHLAQIAGFAGHHYAVEKRESNGRTVAAIGELAGEDRVREIGRMLAGQRLTPEALRHARQMLELSAAE
jgi:DNA repair protein RecN (Recombination protein N)